MKIIQLIKVSTIKRNKNLILIPYRKLDEPKARKVIKKFKEIN